MNSILNSHFYFPPQTEQGIQIRSQITTLIRFINSRHWFSCLFLCNFQTHCHCTRRGMLQQSDRGYQPWWFLRHRLVLLYIYRVSMRALSVNTSTHPSIVADHELLWSWSCFQSVTIINGISTPHPECWNTLLLYPGGLRGKNRGRIEKITTSGWSGRR